MRLRLILAAVLSMAVSTAWADPAQTLADVEAACTAAGMSSTCSGPVVGGDGAYAETALAIVEQHWMTYRLTNDPNHTPFIDDGIIRYTGLALEYINDYLASPSGPYAQTCIASAQSALQTAYADAVYFDTQTSSPTGKPRATAKKAKLGAARWPLKTPPPYNHPNVQFTNPSTCAPLVLSSSPGPGAQSPAR